MDRERYSRLSAEKRHAKITNSLQNRQMRNMNKQGIGNLNFKSVKLHAKHSLVLFNFRRSAYHPGGPPFLAKYSYTG